VKAFQKEFLLSGARQGPDFDLTTFVHPKQNLNPETKLFRFRKTMKKTLKSRLMQTGSNFFITQLYLTSDEF